VNDSNKVASKAIDVAGKNTGYYFVDQGLNIGEKIVLSGAGNLKDGMTIVPQVVSTDSLLKSRPL
jgi:membrane fusion protein (multidrug efflux system)